MSAKGKRILTLLITLFIWINAFTCVYMAYRQKTKADHEQMEQTLFRLQLQTGAKTIDAGLKKNTLTGNDVLNILVTAQSLDLFLRQSVASGLITEDQHKQLAKRLDDLSVYADSVKSNQNISVYADLRKDLVSIDDQFADMAKLKRYDYNPQKTVVGVW